MDDDYTAALADAESHLVDVRARLADPVADAAALLSERDEAMRRVRTLRAEEEMARDAAHRAQLAARREQFLQDLDEPLSWLREAMPRLRYELARLQELERRVSDEGSRSWTEITAGLAPGGVGLIQDAIARATLGSDWEQCYTPPALERLLDAGRQFAQQSAAERQAKRGS